MYISGQLPIKDGKLAYVGQLGNGVSAEDGYEAGKLCALNILAHLKVACDGDLDRVARVLRLGGFVNSTPGFTDAPKCINGASDLMVAVFGGAGRHARAAVSVAALPAGAAVENRCNSRVEVSYPTDSTGARSMISRVRSLTLPYSAGMSKHFLIAALVFASSGAFAQSYPTRPVRLLVGYSPGGAVDITARLAGQHLSTALGHRW